jgi:hypothetical protein
MKNKVEIKNNTVRKTYASRMDYIKEEQLYRLLKGTGLAPELLNSWDGYLEHEYVEGEIFIDLLWKAKSDFEALSKYFEMFYSWYGRYRDITKLTLGRVRFDKFILSGDRLCNIDFEHCKPGYMEEDIANLAAQMCMLPDPFSDSDVDMARLFICVGAQNIEWVPEILAQQFSKALLKECKERKLEYDARKAEYITTLISCAGVVMAGGETPLFDCTDYMAYMPERYVCVSGSKFGISAEAPGFHIVDCIGTSGGTLGRIIEAQKNVKQPWTVYLTTDMPKIPKRLWEELLSAEKKDKAAVIIEAGGKLRKFPLLLNTGMTRIELQSALKRGEKSLIDILSKMPIKVIRLEDLP